VIVRLVIACMSATTIASAVTLLTASCFFPTSRASISVEHGRHIFARRCSNCHSTQKGATAGIGPNLSRIGRDAKDRVPTTDAIEYLFESIVDPGAYTSPGVGLTMPQNTGAGLSDEQLQSLVAFLCSLGGEVNYRKIAQLELKKRCRR